MTNTYSTKFSKTFIAIVQELLVCQLTNISNSLMELVTKDSKRHDR